MPPLLSLLLVLAVGAPATPDIAHSTRRAVHSSMTCDLLGDWRSKGGTGRLRFALEGEALIGRAIEPPQADMTPGYPIVYELSWNDRENRYDGYLARSEDQIIRAEVRCEGEQEMVIKGKMGFLSRSFRWVRVGGGGR